MRARGTRTLMLGLIFVLAWASLAYAATYWADREYPYIITGYSDIVLDGDTATAFSVTYTDYNEPYDELRAHCQLWEDGHFLDSQTEIVETTGWRLIYSYGDGDALEETSSYDGNFWVYGVHRGLLYSMENDITSDGYLSISRRGSELALPAWNAPSLAIAESSSWGDTILVPWYKLDMLNEVLDQSVGSVLMTEVLDAVTPQLRRGDLLPAVAINQEAATALVFVPKEAGGHYVIELKLPATGDTKATDSK